MFEGITPAASELDEIFMAIVIAGGEPYFVGGCVRDELLGLPCEDIDIEVFSLTIQQLYKVLLPFGKISIVGQSFGVMKLTTVNASYDFSLPRTENKIGVGHKDFEIKIDHTMTPFEAAKRRDFTINAIAKNWKGDYIDPHNGQYDLKNGTLRATSSHFAEDPLRVMRGFQFAARYKLVGELTTFAMCKFIKSEAPTIKIERMWGEWAKWAIKGTWPSYGLEFLLKSGWLSLFPELYHLCDVPQSPAHHPEGSVWKHTLHVCDAAARICERECIVGEERMIVMFGALCHDMGKARPVHGGTTEFIHGGWRHYGHEKVGVGIAEKFLKRIGCLERVIEKVLPLVGEHMICSMSGSIDERIVRRLSVRLGKATIKELMLVIEADKSGRPPLVYEESEQEKKVKEITHALSLEVKKPKPIIGGKHLLQLNYKPGPIFKEILNKCFEAQLNGIFNDEVGGVLYLNEEVLPNFNATETKETQEIHLSAIGFEPT